LPLLRLFSNRLLLLFVSLLCILPDGARPGSGTPEETCTGMQQLINNVSFVFRLSLDDSKFQDPENRVQILGALYGPAAVAAQLGDRGEKPGPRYDYFNRSLVRDANDAVLRFRQNHYEGSRLAD
jgi:hypothetical protein